jgi:pimeloyl-ACP methyl ester carboxylesterase
MLKIKVNGVEIYYEEYGTGKEIFVFGQHDMSEEGGIKPEILSFFPPDWHVYLPELPGYGRSTKLREYRGTKQWSEDFYAFSRKLGLDKFIYMGISLLGSVGYQLALDHPEVIKGFVSIVSIPISNPPPWPDPNEENFAASESKLGFPVPTSDKTRLLRRKRFQLLKKRSDNSLDKEGMDIVHRIGKRDGNEFRSGFVKHLPDMKVPILLLIGGQDWSNPYNQVITSAMSIPGAKAVFFQDYGHGLCEEGPEKVADEIIIFVSELNKTGQE